MRGNRCGRGRTGGKGRRRSTGFGRGRGGGGAGACAGVVVVAWRLAGADVVCRPHVSCKGVRARVPAHTYTHT